MSSSLRSLLGFTLPHWSFSTHFNQHIWWYLSRASGIVAWVVAGASCALGTLLATRVLKPYDRPAWLLSLHRYISALFITATLGHMLALAADSYVKFSWRELLVPMASSWHPTAVSLGIIAFYICVLVEVSSLLRKHLSKSVWHSIHLLSYLSFLLISAHAVAAGTDSRNVAFIVTGAAVLSVFLVLVSVKILHTAKAQAPTQERQVLPR